MHLFAVLSGHFSIMGLLAGDRKKQRWSHDPRGKQWSADKNKISNKIMEKMGWKDGEGLGANSTGRIDVSLITCYNYMN